MVIHEVHIRKDSVSVRHQACDGRNVAKTALVSLQSQTNICLTKHHRGYRNPLSNHRL